VSACFVYDGDRLGEVGREEWVYEKREGWLT
jgi:hypothetical protein